MEKFKEYNENHCYQYDIRLNNISSDILESNLDLNEINKLKCNDFSFQYEEKKYCYIEVKKFIEKHEWLGKMSPNPTHIFTARYKSILAGVVIMDMPNSFSKIVGENTPSIERLISRGACISWSPKNLASKLISYSINWMVKNTEYRVFSAYSDTEAKELGTIYQACNFFYIGKKFGARFQHKLESGKWVSSRYFRRKSIYKKFAKLNNLIWKDEWNTNYKVNFELIPINLKQIVEDYMNSLEKRSIDKKHKYIYIKGRTKNETKKLISIFLEKNRIYPYPKKRGE
jgi:hypothetical protein